MLNETQRTVHKHIIPPPIHLNPTSLWKLQREKYKNQRNHSPAVHRRARHIVELGPPREIALPDEVLEHESDEEPRRVVDARRGRDGRYAVEYDGCAHPAHPRLRVSPLIEPEREREECANDECVHLRMVYRPKAKLTIWTDQAPAPQRLVSDCIREPFWTTYQMAEAVKNTSLCGQLKKSGWLGEHMSLTLENIHCFTPIWTKAAKSVAIDWATTRTTSQPQRSEFRNATQRAPKNVARGGTLI
jgi:hypothetical protein